MKKTYRSPAVGITPCQTSGLVAATTFTMRVSTETVNADSWAKAESDDAGWDLPF